MESVDRVVVAVVFLDVRESHWRSVFLVMVQSSRRTKVHLIFVDSRRPEDTNSLAGRKNLLSSFFSVVCACTASAH